MQWSADFTQHAHIDIVKEPARSGNNQKFDTQICCYLDHKEKCQLLQQAMEIQEWENFNGTSDPSDSEDDEGDKPYCMVRNYFERVSSLLLGKFPHAPKPFWTYASTITAYHLTSYRKVVVCTGSSL